MPRTSAGLLMYRRRAGELEVLLVHPGGPFFATKDDGAWSIPKGAVGDGEEPLDAAQREFREETGFAPCPPFHSLGSVRQSGGKTVLAWAFAGDCDPSLLRSNTFTLEWPPRSGRQREYPEVDRAAWLTVAAARLKLLAAQHPLLERLPDAIGS